MDRPRACRGAAAAATWIFRWLVVAAPRPRRGPSVGSSRPRRGSSVGSRRGYSACFSPPRPRRGPSVGSSRRRRGRDVDRPSSHGPRAGGGYDSCKESSNGNDDACLQDAWDEWPGEWRCDRSTDYCEGKWADDMAKCCPDACDGCRGDLKCAWTTCKDSVAQTIDVYQYVVDRYCVDLDAVWATGSSNGGVFAHELASFPARSCRRRVATTPRLPRVYSVESRRRPRLPRGYSVESAPQVRHAQQQAARGHRPADRVTAQWLQPPVAPRGRTRPPPRRRRGSPRPAASPWLGRTRPRRWPRPRELPF